MAVGFGVACPKPPTRKTVKGRKDRAESKVKQSVRAQCVARDGYCRLRAAWNDVYQGMPIPGICKAPFEWAHTHSHRRSQTRNMAPEIRHNTAHSLMLCQFHHVEYDAHKLRITALTRKGADGPLKFARMK